MNVCLYCARMVEFNLLQTYTMLLSSRLPLGYGYSSLMSCMSCRATEADKGHG